MSCLYEEVLNLCMEALSLHVLSLCLLSVNCLPHRVDSTSDFPDPPLARSTQINMSVAVEPGQWSKVPVDDWVSGTYMHKELCKIFIPPPTRDPPLPLPQDGLAPTTPETSRFCRTSTRNKSRESCPFRNSNLVILMDCSFIPFLTRFLLVNAMEYFQSHWQHTPTKHQPSQNVREEPPMAQGI